MLLLITIKHGRVTKPRDGDEVRMAIPAHRTGAVIGRGGETIRALKQQSGCDIELEKAFKGGSADEKYFIIRGTPDKISYAQQLIMERVNGSSTSSGGYT
jgi:far upstream element-binding protein